LTAIVRIDRSSATCIFVFSISFCIEAKNISVTRIYRFISLTPTASSVFFVQSERIRGTLSPSVN
jgi:hypothetical protein